jgi:serine/threonine-protein kinase
LKPANVKITSNTTVKVLDFGLAKLAERSPSVPEFGSSAPTLTNSLITDTRRALGTAEYMSPEQIRGLPVDRLADIWAFGCVLFEMLTGRRAFAGATNAGVIAAVLEREPDFRRLPASTPDAVRRLLRRCLTKDARDRLRDIADARLEIDEAKLPFADPPVARRAASWQRVAAGAVIAAIASGAIVWRAVRPEPVPPQPLIRFTLASRVPVGAFVHGLALSPDGSRLAYRSTQGLVVHERDQTDATVLQDVGTFPGIPFFSPDGEWLAYPDGDLLKKISVTGGAPIAIAEIGPGATATWAAQGIVFADIRGLFRVPTERAPPERLRVEFDPAEQAADPEILPGGRAVLYTVVPSRTIQLRGAASPLGTRVEVLEIESGRRKALIQGARRARYVSTGHVLYAAGGTLHAVAFDLTGLETRGKPVQILNEPTVDFDVSDEGTLVYASGHGALSSTLVWVDRDGREELLGTPPRRYVYPRLSPDGTRVALDVDDSDRDIWMWDVRRKALERLTVDAAGNPLMAWSGDGQRVAFGSFRFGTSNLFIQAANGSGEAERLLVSDRLQMPLAFAPDGRLLFSEEVAGQGRNIHALSLDSTRRVEPLMVSAANELNAEVSADGKWIAYDSKESGQFEVYVRPYPNVNENRWKISTQGGRQPLWSRDGRELFYRDFTGAVMAASVTRSPTFVPGEVTKPLDAAGYAGAGSFGSARTYDVSADGTRFLLIKRLDPTDKVSPSLVVVLNWHEELKRLVPSN